MCIAADRPSAAVLSGPRCRHWASIDALDVFGRAGVRVASDDVGTSCSAFTGLAQLPTNVVEIDGSRTTSHATTTGEESSKPSCNSPKH